MDKGATLSECGKYRYTLERIWDYRKPFLCWLMLNPSKADADIDDNTIGRCKKFTYLWGYGGLHVINLFAFRTKNPAELIKAKDPIGPENNSIIIRYAHWPIIAGWGAFGGWMNRDKAVLKFLNKSDIKCLGITKTGQPWHPLYVNQNTQLQILRR